MVEIYGLYDPGSGELRYVGKAKDSVERFKRHLSEAHLGRPVNNWVKKLGAQGYAPVLKVLAVVPDNEWEQWERDLIAEFRTTHRLLNVADGGALPSQTKEQRRKAAKASNAAQLKKSPQWRELVRAKQNIARLYTRFSRDVKSPASLSLAAVLRFRMRIWAVEHPDRYGAWANL